VRSGGRAAPAGRGVAKPVVNRPLSDALRDERSAAGSAKLQLKRRREKEAQTRTRQVVGGAGLQLTFEEPYKLKPFTHKAIHTKDPIYALTKRTEIKAARRKAVRQLVQILTKNLERFEKKERVTLRKVPNLWPGAKYWLYDKKEADLLNWLVDELCGQCRLRTVMPILVRYQNLRNKREREELLSAFFKDSAITKTFVDRYRVGECPDLDEDS
jgi:hypothetical protein